MPEGVLALPIAHFSGKKTALLLWSDNGMRGSKLEVFIKVRDVIITSPLLLLQYYYNKT